ncbi:MAG: peroxiredoxin [Spirochaetia bacterium]|nr:peroxiredoxin [Spirochaetia bacterium]
MGKIPEEGKKIKDRKVTLTDESSIKLSELSGKKGMILYFYPKDNTPGCTTETCSFNDGFSVLKKMGYTIVGVSPDSPKSHQKFTDKYSLKFPLIADEEKKLCMDAGVWAEKSMYGRKYMGVLRTTFVLEPSLKIIRVYEKVKPAGHAEQIMKDLKDH